MCFSGGGAFVGVHSPPLWDLSRSSLREWIPFHPNFFLGGTRPQPFLPLCLGPPPPELSFPGITGFRGFRARSFFFSRDSFPPPSRLFRLRFFCGDHSPSPPFFQTPGSEPQGDLFFPPRTRPVSSKMTFPPPGGFVKPRCPFFWKVLVVFSFSR